MLAHVPRFRPTRSPAVLTLACFLGGALPAWTRSTNPVSMPRSETMAFSQLFLRPLASRTSGYDLARRRALGNLPKPAVRSRAKPAKRASPQMRASTAPSNFGAFEWKPKASAVPGGIRKSRPERTVLLVQADGSIQDASDEDLPFYRALINIEGLDGAEYDKIALEMQEDALALMKEALKPEEEDEWENGVELSLVSLAEAASHTLQHDRVSVAIEEPYVDTIIHTERVHYYSHNN
jgi:hypothetical protein